MKKVRFVELTEIDTKRKKIKKLESNLRNLVNELHRTVEANEEFYCDTRQRIIRLSSKIYNLICECDQLSRPSPDLTKINTLIPRKKKPKDEHERSSTGID